MCATPRFLRPLGLACLLLLATLTGCESSAAVEGRQRVEFDNQVESVWKKKWDWVDGLKFLEKGGLYVDNGDPGEPAFDKPQVLPLLERLSSTHGLKWHAVVDKRKRSFAVAVVGRYPDKDGIQKAVLDSLNEEQKTFPMDILVQSGDRWLSLDFLSAEDAAFLNDDTPLTK